MSASNFNSEKQNSNLIQDAKVYSENFHDVFNECNFNKAITEAQKKFGSECCAIKFQLKLAQKEILIFLYNQIKTNHLFLKTLFSTDEFLDLFSKTFLNQNLAFCAWILPDSSVYAIHSCPKIFALTIAQKFYEKKHSQTKPINLANNLNNHKQPTFATQPVGSQSIDSALYSLGEIDAQIFINQLSYENQIISAINIQNTATYKAWCSNILATHSSNNTWNNDSSLNIDDFKLALTKFNLFSDFSFQAIEQRLTALHNHSNCIEDVNTNNVNTKNTFDASKTLHSISQITAEPYENNYSSPELSNQIPQPLNPFFISSIFDCNLSDFNVFDELTEQDFFVKMDKKNVETLSGSRSLILSSKKTKPITQLEESATISTILPSSQSVESTCQFSSDKINNDESNSLKNKTSKDKSQSLNAKKNIQSQKIKEPTVACTIDELIDNPKSIITNNEPGSEHKMPTVSTTVHEPIVYKNRAARIIVPKIEPSDFLPSTRAALEERTKQRTLGKVGKFAKDTFSKKTQN